MAKRKVENVFLLDGGAMKCFACGAKYNPYDPDGLGIHMNRSLPIGALTAQMKWFTDEHKRCGPPKKEHDAKPATTPMEWLAGEDTGTSSRTIFTVMQHVNALHGGTSHNPPMDPSDFGRCYRLLESFPEWKARMPEVAARWKVWGPWVREWAALTAMFLAEVPNGVSGSAPKMYARMKEIQREAMIVDGWKEIVPGNWSREARP